MIVDALIYMLRLTNKSPFYGSEKERYRNFKKFECSNYYQGFNNKKNIVFVYIQITPDTMLANKETQLFLVFYFEIKKLNFQAQQAGQYSKTDRIYMYSE